MALPSSGSISLNQMHVEAGGTSGTQCTINDADIRGLISKGSGVQMSFNEWYGASNVVTEELNFEVDYQAPYQDETHYATGTSDNYNQTQLDWIRVNDQYVCTRFRDAVQTNNLDYLTEGSSSYTSVHPEHKICDFWIAPNYLSNPNNEYLPYIANNIPFPSHQGTIGGWRYFAKRGEQAQQAVYWDGMAYMWFKVHRTTSTTYPY